MCVGGGGCVGVCVVTARLWGKLQGWCFCLNSQSFLIVNKVSDTWCGAYVQVMFYTGKHQSRVIGKWVHVKMIWWYPCHVFLWFWGAGRKLLGIPASESHQNKPLGLVKWLLLLSLQLKSWRVWPMFCKLWTCAVPHCCPQPECSGWAAWVSKGDRWTGGAWPLPWPLTQLPLSELQKRVRRKDKQIKNLSVETLEVICSNLSLLIQHSLIK